MKQIRKRLTYANVMSTIAVFFVVGGASALAATELAKNSVGTPQLKGNAVTTGKIKKEAVAAAKIKNGAVGTGKLGAGAVTVDKLGANAVSTEKLANDAVTAGKLAGNAVSTEKIASDAVTSGKLAGNAVSTEKIVNSAVTTGKLANDAVTTAKLANSSVGATQLTESERSQAFVSPTSAATQALANGVFGSYTPAESVTSLTLPAGTYIVTAQSEFINADTTLEYTSIHHVICRLLDDGAEVTEQSATVTPGLLSPSGGVTAMGVSDGGQLNLACRQAATNKISAYKAKIIATRVGAVTGP